VNEKREPVLSQGPIQLPGAYSLELLRVDRALAQVARPAITEDWFAPFTHSQLVDLGIYEAFPLGREALIERLWSRKRLLLHQLGAFDDGEPESPSA
jgi:hypothetical protein